jgi:ketosteroid isomerase-like protein
MNLLAFALMTGLAVAPAAAGDALMEEVTAIGDAMEKAMVAGDLDTIMAFYLEDAISLPEYAPMIEGRDAIRQHQQDMVMSGIEITAFESSPHKVWQAGDLVVEIGTYRLSAAMPGSPMPMDDRGKYVTVYQRQQDGALKVKLEAWNTDLNPLLLSSGQARQETGG